MKEIFNLFLKILISKRNNLILNIILKFIFLFKSKYFSLNGLDKKLEKYVNFDKGFYVELGANNGFDQSNTLYFEVIRDWEGILIEPLQHKYFECKKLRGVKNKIFCNACVSKEYDKDYIYLDYLNLMTLIEIPEYNLGKRSKNQHIEYGKKSLKPYETYEKLISKTDTLNNILIKSKAPKLIDFLSLDVEGSELEVLKGVNFKNYNFKFILIELHDFEKGKEFLVDKKYKFIDKFSENDYLFKYIGV